MKCLKRFENSKWIGGIPAEHLTSESSDENQGIRTASATVQKRRYVDPASQIGITMERQCLRWWTAHPPPAPTEGFPPNWDDQRCPREVQKPDTQIYTSFTILLLEDPRTHRTERQSLCQLERQKIYISNRMRDCQIACQTKCHKICQIKCQKISRIECQKICLIGQSNIWQPIFQINH